MAVRLTSQWRMLRSGVTSIDSSDLTLPEGNQTINPGYEDRLLINAACAGGGSSATVQLMVWDSMALSWFSAKTITFSAPGAQQVSLDNPGGVVWPKVTAVAGGGSVSVSVATQREKH